MTPAERAEKFFRDFPFAHGAWYREERLKPLIADAIRAAVTEAVAKEFQRCCAALCDGCADGHPFIGATNPPWHTDKDGKGGKWICDAAAIREGR